MTGVGLTPQVSNAILRALEVVGHHPDQYDVDAVYGTIVDAGIQFITSDHVMAQSFEDRCDFECSVCHPEDDQ